MDQPAILMHPEGTDGRWVFRSTAPNIGDVHRGEISVNVVSEGQEVAADLQKAAAIVKIKELVAALAQAAEAL